MNTPLRRLSVGRHRAVPRCCSLSATSIQFVQASSLNAHPGNAGTSTSSTAASAGRSSRATPSLAASEPVNDLYKYLRTYPAGPLYAHVTGYYSASSARHRRRGEPRTPALNGTADQLFYRRISDLLTGRQPKGASVELTDRRRGAAGGRRGALGGQKGAVVALDPKTGAILAMVSAPTYDPNTLATHDRTKADGLQAADSPTRTGRCDNRAIAGRLYPPGSTFKLITSCGGALDRPATTRTRSIAGPAELRCRRRRSHLPNDDRQPCGPAAR